jgi:serine/threonine protein kinase
MIGAIKDLHFMGYIHRDIKPKNMCIVNNPIDELPMLKLIDFGISKQFVDFNKTHIK